MNKVTDFIRYLNSFKISTRGNFNYVRVKKGGGKYYIPEETEESFLKKYAKCTKILLKSGKNLNLAQRPFETKPLVVDIDLKTIISKETIFDSNEFGSNRLISDEMIFFLAKTYCKVFKNIYTEKALANIEKTDPRIYVMKRPKADIIPGDANSKNLNNRLSKLKDGFHFVIPGIVMNKPTARFITNTVKIISQEPKTGMFFDYKDQKWLDDVVMENNSWMLYGSGKERSVVYLVNYAINIFSEEVEEVNLSLKNLVLLFNMHGRDISTGPIKQEYLSEIQMRFTSKSRKNILVKIDENENPEISEDFLETIEKALFALDITRCNDYNDWFKIVAICKSASLGDKRVFEIVERFSMQSPKFEKLKFHRLWERLEIKKGFSWGPIYKLLKEDNPEVFKEFMRKNIISRILRVGSKKWNDYKIAKIVKKMVKNRYKTDFGPGRGSSSFIFYKFLSSGIWKKMEDPVELRIFISEQMSDYFGMAVQLQSKKLINTISCGIPSASCKEKLDSLIGITTRLGDFAKKSRIIKELQDLLYEEDFSSKLDKKGHLFAFKNGVYDFSTKEFRIGTPEDMISRQAKCNFIEDLNIKSNQDIKEIKKFFRDVLPCSNGSELAKYFLILVSKCLLDNLTDPKCYMCRGNGSNGKSVLFNLIRKSFGEYSVEMPTTYFTDQKGIHSAAARPDVLLLKSRRLVYSSECKKSNEFNLAEIKIITGGNLISGREVYGRKIEQIRPTFRLFFQVNDLPHLPDTGRSVRRRFQVIPFERDFYSEGEIILNQKFPPIPIDPDMEDKITHWAESGIFLTYLVHIYNKYANKSVIVPNIIKEKTLDYFNQNDYVRKFCNEKIISNTPDENISINVLYITFRDWIKTSGFTITSIPSKEDFVVFLKELYGAININKNYLLNVKLEDYS